MTKTKHMTIGELETKLRVQAGQITDLCLALRMLASHATDGSNKLPPMHFADEQFLRKWLAWANAR